MKTRVSLKYFVTDCSFGFKSNFIFCVVDGDFLRPGVFMPLDDVLKIILNM